MVKLLMSWDIQAGREQPYLEFVVREFAPGLMRMGLHLTEAWYTIYGNGSQVLIGGVTSDIDAMRKFLAGEDWHTFHKKLLGYVTNYKQKVVPAGGQFQL